MTSRRAKPSEAEYRRARELRAALRTFLRASDQVLRKHGLTTERYELLLFVQAASTDKGQGVTVSELCPTMQLAQSSVTQLVRRAENLGLLRRNVSPRDARVRYLCLTPKGEQRLADAVAELGEERAKLRTILNRAPSRSASRAKATRESPSG